MRKSILVFFASIAVNPVFAGGPYPAISGIGGSADDAVVAGQNPAAMTRFDERNMKFEVLGFFSDNTWEGRLGDEGPEFRSKDSNTTIIPSGNMVMPVRDNLWFGWTILGSGFSDDYDDDSPIRYLIEEYDLIYVSAFPSLATKVNDRLSLAASLALTYTSYEQIKAVPNLPPGSPDGRLVIDADGWTAGWALSGLYEFSETTRFGMSYRSEIDPDLSGKAKFSDLGEITESILDAAGLIDAKVNVISNQPQSVVAGIYHEFEDSSAVTVDAVWSDFSEFTLSEIYVSGDRFIESDPKYDDIFAVSASYSRQVADRWRVGIGGFVTNDMIEDEERTMTLRLDRIWSIGAGFEWLWKPGRRVSATLNYLKIDDAPIASPPIGNLGSVSGRFTDRGTVYLRVGLTLGAP